MLYARTKAPHEVPSSEKRCPPAHAPHGPPPGGSNLRAGRGGSALNPYATLSSSSPTLLFDDARHVPAAHLPPHHPPAAHMRWTSTCQWPRASIHMKGSSRHCVQLEMARSGTVT